MIRINGTVEISDPEYLRLVEKIEAYDQERRAKFGDNPLYPLEEKMIFSPKPTNEERSAVEVTQFKKEIPNKYFVYIDDKTGKATTWVGDILGTVKFGKPYKSRGFGGVSVRVPIRVAAINGKEYYGTYYKSSGSYARIKLSKNS